MIFSDDDQPLLEESRREAQAAEEVLLTAKQYASLLGIHVQSVYSQIRYGRCACRVIKVSTAKKAPIRIAVPRESINTLKHA